MTVLDVARTGVTTASSDQTAGNLATVTRAENVGSVIIEDGEPVGIVRLDDLLVLLSTEMEHLTEVVEADSPSY